MNELEVDQKECFRASESNQNDEQQTAVDPIIMCKRIINAPMCIHCSDLLKHLTEKPLSKKYFFINRRKPHEGLNSQLLAKDCE